MSELPSYSVVLQDHLTGVPRWLAFRHPVAIVTSANVADVLPCLHEIETRTRRGLYAAGFMSYEASAAMDGALETHRPGAVPPIWFGLYERSEVLTLQAPVSPSFELGSWQPSVSLAQYRESITAIKQAIRRGDTYQINYTLRLRSPFRGDPWAMFVSLYRAQRSSYSAYINLGRHHICSVSPELFFSLRQGKLTCKPMKGTARRGCTTNEDREWEQWLMSSPKNRAENVMIVDMIRNDMGRIATAGSVRVEKLFCVEKYPTVLQMVSTVTSQVTVPLSDIFRTMFPCASITGAPKVKSMEIIRKLEPDPRGVYTGSIGYISPEADGQFNVAIRTAVLDLEERSAEYGVGSGIVWDSVAEEEYEECRTKARVLRHQYPEFDLIETILWTANGELYLLDYHLQRLQDSAAYFQFPLPLQELQEELRKLARVQQGSRKVRVTLCRDGKLTVEWLPVVSICGSKVGLAKRAVSRRSPFLHHKTSHRQLYAELLEEQRVHQPDLTDLIAWNDAGCITESSIANVVINDGAQWFTPPLDQGLLPGVFRKHLVQQGIVSEKQIRIDELLSARTVCLINSVRGWMPLDRSAADDTWIIRSDLNYDTPAA